MTVLDDPTPPKPLSPSARVEHVGKDADADTIDGLLARDGGLIIDGLVGPDVLARLRSELDPFLDTGSVGDNDFSGFRTKRIGALIARSPACRELAVHPMINAACERLLSPYCQGYQLHFTQAVSIGPGERGQMLHRDRGVWGGYVNRKIETQFSTIWAVNDFTHANGATRIVPGSHTWAADREPTSDEIASADMTAGSVLIYTGSVIHGGGANETDANRIGVLLHYAPNWLRQEENQYLSCPPEIAKTLSPELRALLGYTTGGQFLGFYSSPTQPGERGVEIGSPERLFDR
jgi:hypothetical protein